MNFAQNHEGLFVDDNTSKVYDTKDNRLIRWDIRNNIGSIRINSPLSKKTFINFNFYRTEYVFNAFDFSESLFLEQGTSRLFTRNFDSRIYRTGITDLSANLRMDYSPNSVHYIKLGAEYINHSFRPGTKAFNQNTQGFDDPTIELREVDFVNSFQDANYNSDEYVFYLEDDITLSYKMKLNLGISGQLFDFDGRYILIPQPRLLLNSKFKNYNFKLGIGNTGQFLHQLTNNGIGIPVDQWLPSTESLRPQRAWSIDMGHFVSLSEKSKFSMETFYKYQYNILNVDAQSVKRIFDLTDERADLEVLETGNGKA